MLKSENNIQTSEHQEQKQSLCSCILPYREHMCKSLGSLNIPEAM